MNFKPINQLLNKELPNLRLPTFIKDTFGPLDAWLVGGGAKYLKGIEKTVKDWDLVLPESQIIHHSDFVRTLNKCGFVEPRSRGYRFTHDNGDTLMTYIDFWYNNIGIYLSEVPKGSQGLAYRLRDGTILYTSEFVKWMQDKQDIDIKQLRKVNGKLSKNDDRDEGPF